MQNNIIFKIGQPSTGKSFGFRLKSLKETEKFKNLTQDEYKLIPVSGGVGNEYKGLQNTDLAISYDVVNENIKLGEFLKILMKAIQNPTKNYVVFLDDFHNQDISSLLSEYTPLFKSQQKINLTDKIKDIKELQEKDFNNTSEFITKWNSFIDTLKDIENIAIIPIANRISGEDIKLVYPSNFFLFGAGNFNEKTVSIFADWTDRADIEYIDPFDEMKKFKEKYNKAGENEFINTIFEINNNLKDILEDIEIYDIEKYCFGIWKVLDEENKITTKKVVQKILIRFFFSMINNSLIYNNKNSYINDIGIKLLEKMKDDELFKKLFEEELKDEINNKTLHSFGIYNS
jgi:hypothetical protein